VLEPLLLKAIFKQVRDGLGNACFSDTATEDKSCWESVDTRLCC
jgi:hypothetical protein